MEADVLELTMRGDAMDLARSLRTAACVAPQLTLKLQADQMLQLARKIEAGSDLQEIAREQAAIHEQFEALKGIEIGKLKLWSMGVVLGALVMLGALALTGQLAGWS